jgi:hypothetical protein
VVIYAVTTAIGSLSQADCEFQASLDYMVRPYLKGLKKKEGREERRKEGRREGGKEGGRKGGKEGGREEKKEYKIQTPCFEYHANTECNFSDPHRSWLHFLNESSHFKGIKAGFS